MSSGAEVPSTPPDTGDDWVGLHDEQLPLAQALGWAVLRRCGGLAVFLGTVRDHSEGRPGVTGLEYEAYPEQVGPRLSAVAGEARRRWPAIGRLVMLHRTGHLAVTDPSVLVAVSAPHREEAFSAARFCIDALKATVPIWKRETWEGGSDWALCSHEVAELEDASQR